MTNPKIDHCAARSYDAPPQTWARWLVGDSPVRSPSRFIGHAQGLRVSVLLVISAAGKTISHVAIGLAIPHSQLHRAVTY